MKLSALTKIVFSVVLSELLCTSQLLAIEPGAIAPGFSLSSFKGGSLSLDALRGKVIYLDFWASWCAPCRISLPCMDALQKKFADSGLVVLAVNEDSKSADASKVLDQLHPAFTGLVDDGGKVAALYNPATMPSSFLIDRKGVVRLVHPGFKEADPSQLETEIEKLLTEK